MIISMVIIYGCCLQNVYIERNKKNIVLLQCDENGQALEREFRLKGS